MDPPITPTKPNSKVPESPTTGSFASLKTGIDGLIIRSAVLASGSTATGSGGKEPLSLQTTSVNFRKFVQKSGPIFAAQDAAEAVLRWDDPAKTLFFGAAYVFLCLYPALLFVLPNVVLASVLLYTHGQRPTPTSPTIENGNGNGGPEEKTTPIPNLPPAEGSVDYIANLTHIQHMMGHISDLSDFGRSFVPYLSWRDERTTLVLLQLTVLSGLFIAFLAPLIPWRYVLLVLGCSGLVAGHPVCVKMGTQLLPILSKEGKKWNLKINRLIEDDSLTEEELDGEIIEVERFDSESKMDGSWMVDVVVGGDLPSGGEWKWLSRGDWLVDVVGGWADGNVDDVGWTYLFIDGTRSASPTGNGTTSGQANSRRRRLVRRAWRPAQA